MTPNMVSFHESVASKFHVELSSELTDKDSAYHVEVCCSS